MVYYKDAGNGERIKLDDKGNKSPSFNKKNKPGLWAEMQSWIDAGGVVEPQFSAEELAAKEAEEIEAAKVAYKGLRKSAYNEAGLTFDAWNELVIEKNTAGQTAFRAARDVIRAEILPPD